LEARSGKWKKEITQVWNEGLVSRMVFQIRPLTPRDPMAVKKIFMPGAVARKKSVVLDGTEAEDIYHVH
jgi:hypothetical protein